jgi:release factor glutamine methyltransferase
VNQKAAHSVETWLRRAVGQLSEARVDSPALDAELLLADVLQCNRSVLLTHPERELDEGQEIQYRSLVTRRVQREPVAYILGIKEFYGFDLAVNRNVLIPRPETEDLVDLAVSWLRRRRVQISAGPLPVIVDVGTGSGALAIALALHAPDAIVYAIDASPIALETARTNITRHRLDNRIQLAEGDLLTPAPAEIDLIVANLPYIETDEIATLMPEVSQYEPHMALDGGADGLDLVRKLLQQAQSRLRAGGAIMLEIGSNQGAAATAEARALYPLARVSIERDLAGLDRVLVIDHLHEAVSHELPHPTG